MRLRLKEAVGGFCQLDAPSAPPPPVCDLSTEASGSGEQRGHRERRRGRARRTWRLWVKIRLRSQQVSAGDQQVIQITDMDDFNLITLHYNLCYTFISCRLREPRKHAGLFFLPYMLLLFTVHLMSPFGTKFITFNSKIEAQIEKLPLKIQY